MKTTKSGVVYDFKRQNRRFIQNRKFFSVKNCERCSNNLDSRMLSWFTSDVICVECAAKEAKLRKELRKVGKDPHKYEGCGFVPDPADPEIDAKETGKKIDFNINDKNK